MTQQVTLMGDKVLIKPDPAETMVNGIIVPDNVQKLNRKGTVMGAGKGCYDENTGVFIPVTVKIGDKVLISSDAVAMSFEDCLLMSEKEIITILK